MEGFVNNLRCFDCKNCFSRSSLFKALTESELDCLNESRIEVGFKSGEILYKQGAPLTHLVIIHSGIGKKYFEGAGGRNLVLTFTKPLEVNGGIGIFINDRHYSSLMAVTDCQACFIEIKAFKSILKSNPEFMSEYLRQHSLRIAHLYNKLTVLTQKNMEGRMADSIIFLEDDIFKNGEIEHVSKHDLAELTAMTKESAIRVLKVFKEEGHIEIDKQRIKILNKKALQQIALHG
jgi:CRP/FNR family transcriptional regulator, polysaccharide utilization system transcription regulator